MEKGRAKTYILIMLSVSFMLIGSEFAGSAGTVFPSGSINQGSNAETGKKKSDIDYPVKVLREDAFYQYDRLGRRRYTFKRKYRILNQKGIKQWNFVSASWYEWYQERPVVKATVTAPDGTVTMLDPKTVGEVAAQQSDDLVYSDRKTIRGPLPALSVGTVVEEEYIYQDKKPFVKSGSQQWYRFNGTLPVEESRLTIEVPKEMALVYELHQLKIEPVIKEEGSFKSYTFVIKKMEPKDSPPIYRPIDTYYWSSVVFSTVPDWNSVAREYNAIVERQMSRSKNIAVLAKGIKKDKADKNKVIQDIMSRIHRVVRYTGVEFGNASIVPRSPDEVLERKYGDCKDKSILLISLLKKFGIKAHVALLNAGFSTDIPSRVPGLEFFNHAIVYVPEPYNLWIDPTAEFTPVGQLPMADRERNALIISPETKSLVRTPLKKSIQNTVVRTREIFMSQLGESKIDETLVFKGDFASSMRSYYHEQNRKKVKENFEGYIKDTYGTKKLDRYTLTRPMDFSENFTMKIKVSRSTVGFTFLDDATVKMNIWPLFSKLPGKLMDFKNYNGLVEPASSRWKDRKEDLQLPNPHRYKLIYKIHVPPGFRAMKIPENKKTTAGTTVLERKIIVKGSVIQVVFSIDTAGGRFSASDLRKLRKEIYSFGDSQSMSIKLISHSARLMEKGRIGQCAKIYKSLISRYPNEPGNFVRLGRVILTAGFKKASIDYFKKAYAIDKKCIEAYMSMGWAYLHDDFGRYMEGEFQKDEAWNIYKKITELDKDIFNAWRNLAILSEFDSDGNRYSLRSKLKNAITYYEIYRNKLKRKDLDYNYLLVLFYTSQYERILGHDRKDFKNDESWSLYMASLAVKKGLDVMTQHLDSISSDNAVRGKILESAADNLANVRQYKLAADLLEQLSRSSENAIQLSSRASYLRKIKRYENITVDDSKPESAVYRFMKMVYLDELTSESVSSSYSKLSLSLGNVNALLKEYKRIQKNFIRTISGKGKLHKAVFDLIYSNMKFHVEGNDKIGYKISVAIDLWNNDVNEVFFIIKEDGKYKIMDSFHQFPSALGALALEHYGKGNFSHAATVLDWAFKYTRGGVTSEFRKHPFFHVWELKSSDKGKIDLAATVLLSGYEKYLDKLIQMRSKIKDKKLLLQIDRSLQTQYLNRKNYSKALDVTQRILDAGKDDTYMVEVYYHLIHKTGRGDRYKGKIDRLLKDNPDNADYILIKATSLVEKRKLEEAAELLEDAHRKNLGSSRTYNLLAWMGLYTGRPLGELLDLSLKSNRMSGYKNHAYLHTLATIYSDMEKVSESKQVINQMLKKMGKSTVEEVDHYILGRNAETLGLPDIALSHYRKIKKEDSGFLTVYELASRRIKILEKK